MGKAKLSKELGISKDKAEILLNKYNSRVPFVKKLASAVTQSASKFGFIRTIKGRKCRFDLWEPTQWGVHKALPLNQAKLEYGDAIKRAGTYKALNRLIQGSAADQTKKAMVDVFEQLAIVPHIQVHDELNCSVRDENEGKKVKEVMETCVDLEVPSKVDINVGESWGG